MKNGRSDPALCFSQATSFNAGKARKRFDVYGSVLAGVAISSGLSPPSLRVGERNARLTEDVYIDQDIPRLHRADVSQAVGSDLHNCFDKSGMRWRLIKMCSQTK
jgi:hypothetical protein